MSAAPVSLDEVQRLRRLYQLRILDTLSEDFSQSVAAAAATIANTPIAAISMIDKDRQWFKGSCGLTMTETSREVSFCAHAILESTPLVIENAMEDRRFLNNALVLGEPHIRFYAGFPLIFKGQAVGALCVIDDRARTLSMDQVDKLITLASATSAWLSLRQAP